MSLKGAPPTQPHGNLKLPPLLRMAQDSQVDFIPSNPFPSTCCPLHPGCVIERGVKYSGNNLSNKKGISQRTCALLCFRTSSCTHWTYNKKFQGGKCWLKSSNKGRTRSTKGSNSGQKSCGAKGFSLSMLTSEAAAAMEECRDPWTQLSTGCYLFQPRNSSWYEAKQACRQSGGHLVEIESSEEWEALREAILSETWDDTNIDGIWIGLNDVFHDGTWVWDHSGRPLELSRFWAPGEPDNFGGAQHCGISLTNSSESRVGKWIDVSCEENQLHLGTVCEAPGIIYFCIFPLSSVEIESLAGQRNLAVSQTQFP